MQGCEYPLSRALAGVAKQWVYWLVVLLLSALVKVLFRARFAGRENIPVQGAIVVARHTSYWDVPLTAVALQWRRRTTFVARHTLQQEYRLLKPFIRAYAIPVDREHFHASDFKNVLRAIRENPLVAIFPEGTIKQTGQVYPGVIRFAELTGRQYLPVRFLARRGQYPPPTFLRLPALTVVVGRPFTLKDLEFDLRGDEAKEERAQRLAQLLMQRIDEAEPA